jgi:phosphate-selective porin OprO and OprP
MAARLVSTFLASTLAAFAFANTARADETEDKIKKLVKDEIKAQNDKKKEADTKDGVFKVKWKDGVYMETPDKQYTFKIGGRIHLDSAFTEADDGLEGAAPGIGDDFDDATYFRRLRLYIQGDLTKHVDYKIQVDFADPSDPQIRDAYITIKELKDCWGCWVPQIRAGHQYDPIGLETTSSSNHNAFIERSLTTTLHPERAIGLNFLDSFWNEHATAQLGVFSTSKETDDVDGFALWDESDTDGGYAVTGRFTLVPWAADTCRFLHLGVSASYREGDEVRYRARPGLGRGPRVVDTGNLTEIEDHQIYNAELAFVWNSFHAAAEYTLVDISNPVRGDPQFTAWYVQAGWFITGEAKAYDFKRGGWGNNKPCCNFLSNNCCCSGAWELVARYDMLDLNDGTLNGGEMTNIAVGINWYLSPNARLMFNYVLSNTQDRNGPSGVVIDDADVNSFLMRWDVHF